MTGNTMAAPTNTSTGSISRWTLSATVGSIFAVLIVLGLAVPPMRETIGDKLRSADNLRPRSASLAAAVQEQRNLRTIDATPMAKSYGKIGSVAKQLMGGTIRLTETQQSVSWQGAVENDMMDLQMSYSYDFDRMGSMEQQKSYSYGFDVFEDKMTRFGEDYSYSYSMSYGFDVFEGKMTRFGEDYSYSYSMSYEL